MPEISNLTRQKIVNAEIDLGDGDTVLVSFDANKITPAWVRDTERRVEDRDTLSLPKALAEVILSWDVTQDGAEFPPTADNIAVFSFGAMSALFERVMGAAVPSSAEGNASSDTSSLVVQDSTLPQANPQNGPTPSVSPQPSEYQSTR
jgi:hypothetical protein